MHEINKTFEIENRLLSEVNFDKVYETGMEAFSDYLISVKLTHEQFQNNLSQNGACLDHSVGAFSGEKLVGYALFSIGLWDKKQTAYNTGTGVVPKFRNMRVGKGMAGFAIPKLRENGAGQILLEVIENNTNAVKLYQNLGFEFSRRLLLLEQTNGSAPLSKSSVSIREMMNPD